MKRSVEGVYVADALDCIGEYANLDSHFAKAVEFLQRVDLRSLPNGRYAIDGENAYAMIQEATLREWGSARPEIHHAYFDIQVPLSNDEIIGVGRFDPRTPGMFDEKADIGFYADAPVDPLELHPGEFAILYPTTCAHAPCCSIDAAGLRVRKIVVKVRKWRAA